MAAEIDLAPRHGPFAGTLDPAAIDQYAAATNDTNAPVVDGHRSARDVPGDPDLRRAVGGQRRGAQVGVRERTQRGARRARGAVAPPVGAGRDAGDVLRAVRGAQHAAPARASCCTWSSSAPTGRSRSSTGGPSSSPAATSSPTWARNHRTTRSPTRPVQHPVGSATQHVDIDAATRYAEVSNDWSAHHFELDAARKAGVDYLFAHGLCTMAMCTQAAVGDGRRR